MLMIGALSSQAQKCNFNLNENDKETGTLHRKILVSLRNELHIWLDELGGKKSLSFELVFPEIRREVINAGDSLVIVMGNDDFIYLKAKDKAEPVGKSDEKTEQTDYFPVYTMSNTEWDRMAAANVKAIQLYIAHQPNLYEFTDKESKKIAEAMKCLK